MNQSIVLLRSWRTDNRGLIGIVELFPYCIALMLEVKQIGVIRSVFSGGGEDWAIPQSQAHKVLKQTSCVFVVHDINCT